MARKKQENLEEKMMESELGPTADDIIKLWNESGSTEEETEVTEEEKGTEEPTEEEKPQAEEKKEEYEELLKLLPEKFRSQDPKEALKRFVESYRDLESRLTQTSMELTEATKLLRTLAGASSAQPVPESQSQKEGEDVNIKFDIKPDEYYQNLPEAVQKTVVQAIKQAVQQYRPDQYAAQAMQQVMAQMALAQLRSRDPKTFELVKGDLLQVLREKPHLDTIEGLEIAYEEAKQRYKARQEELRKQLIDENFVNSLKEGILRELASKVGSQAREATGVPQEATGGGSSEVAKKEVEKKSPSEVLSDMILSVGAKAPLLTEDF